MKDILQWLADNSKGAADCKQQEISCGTFDLSYTFPVIRDRSDPMSMRIRRESSKEKQCDFIVREKEKTNLNVQFIKKIENTPFFYSLVNTADFDLHIVDFYCWQEPVLCIRFFYCDILDNNVTIEKTGFSNVNGLYELFEQVTTETKDAAHSKKGYVYILSTHPIDQKQTQLSTLLSTLSLMTRLCRQNHISRHFRTAECHSMTKLDWYWSQQKFINPDLSIPAGVRKNKRVVILRRYLDEYFAWQTGEGSLPAKLILKSQEETTTDIALLYHAFIGNISQDQSVGLQLNRWWALYSLPLMERKFNQLIKSEPEYLTMIALLAIQYQFSWREALADRMISGRINSFYKLIIWLSVRILIRETDDNLYIYPGFQWDNNLKEVERIKEGIRIKCTRYSKKEYIAVYQEKRKLYQADHRIQLVYNAHKNTIVGSPLIDVSSLSANDITNLSLTIDENFLSQPLLFRNGEVYFSDLRFRWILKKRRFQITLMNKNRNSTISLNNAVLDFTHSLKSKYYIEVPLSKPFEHILFLDQNGSLIHRRNVSGHRQIFMTGWALDKNGTFYKTINYSAGRRQHVINADAGGRFSTMIIIPSERNSFDIILKGVPRITKHLTFSSNPAWEKVLFYKSEDYLYPFALSIEAALNGVLPKIRSFFLDTFAFVPKIVEYRDSQVHLALDSSRDAEAPCIAVGRSASNIKTILQVLVENSSVFK